MELTRHYASDLLDRQWQIICCRRVLIGAGGLSNIVGATNGSPGSPGKSYTDHDITFLTSNRLAPAACEGVTRQPTTSWPVPAE